MRTFTLSVMVLFSLNVMAQDFAGGSGTPEDPWQIATAQHLDNIRNYLGLSNSDKYFVQTANINLGVEPWNQGEGWNPIGSGEQDESFCGIYDGGGFTISNLFINRSGADNQGLFGYTLNATLHNITMENVDISVRQYCGAVVARAVNNIIENISVTGVINAANSHIGGIAGSTSEYCMLNNFFADIEIEGTEYVGGVVGYLYQSEIRHAGVAGSVSGTYRVGGLVGSSYMGSVITDSYSRALVTGTNYVGGLVGEISNCLVIRSYSSGQVSGVNSDTGGLIGKDWSGSGGVADSYWDIGTSGLSASSGGEGLTTAEMQSQSVYSTYNFNSVWEIDEGVDYPVFKSFSLTCKPASSGRGNVLAGLCPKGTCD